jgi:DNA-binding NarL/FixJ family response regulator
MAHVVRITRVLASDADPQALAHLRATLAGCPDLALTAAPGDWHATLELTAELLPDVALVDAGPELIRALLARSPATNVVVLTAVLDRLPMLAAVKAGARGYLLKDDDPAGLPDAIRAAARGESPLAPRAASVLMAGHRLARHDARLPAMEKRVLALLARGRTDAEILELLDLAPAELDRVLGVIGGALGVADRTQAALWAQRHGYAGGDGDPAYLLTPFTQAPGRIRRSVRPTGKRPVGRVDDAEGCEDRGRGRRDGADAGDRRVR